MTTNYFNVSIFVCILLQFYAFNNISALDIISSCKTSEYYGVRNVELSCANDDLSTDIFTNTSTTETISCLDKSTTKTDSINSVSFTDCIFHRAPVQLFNYFSLKTIDLRSTSLQRLDKYDFVDTPYLKKLIAINNSLTSIEAKLFRFAPAIESLFLSHNQIAVVDPQAFNTTHDITFLDLSNNKLPKVSKSLLDTLPKLESLYLSRNSITEIEPSAFSALSRLDALDLDGNKLETLASNTFAGLWFAFRLDLSSNSIKRIEGGAFSALSNLLRLQLNSNAIDSGAIQPDAFQGLRKVYTLEMNHNKLTILRNGMFGGLPDLQYLELRDNRIVTIEPLAFDHAELQHLDLSSNQISELSSDVFSHAPNMNHVNLSYANIAEIKEDFLSSAPKLRVLDLSFCQLKTINFNHFSHFAETLRSLYVDGNGLSELHSEIREILPNLSDLGLTNNNFSCSYVSEIYPTIGAKLLSRAVGQHPVASNERNVHGIRCY